MTTCEDQAHDGLLFSQRLAPDPSCVGAARRRLRTALDELGLPEVAAIADDAALVISELVTNALLHAGGEITVAASYDEDRVLLQVIDDSPHIPQPRRYGEEARTGRGLQLVEQLSDDWGYVRHPEGKTVWVRWSLSSRAAKPAPAAGPSSTDDAGSASEPTGDVVEVTLLELPLLLHAAWRAHAQALLRDYLLATLGAEDDDLAAIRTHSEITDAIAVLDEHLPPMAVDGEAPLAAALEPEVTVPRAVVPVPRTSVPHFDVLDRASDAALDLADQGELLTPPTLPELQAFRRWVCQEVREQARGWPASPFGVPFGDWHGSTTPDGWDPAPVRSASTGVIAADSASRIVAVSRPAADLLGYADPDELVGQRLVAVIPRRLRQAHVAGMTMYLLADRRPLIDHRVVVPALRRDGTEVEVELLIREQPTAAERPVLVAEIGPTAG